MPGRGGSSISWAPSARSRSSSAADVVDLEGDVVHARPALREEPPDRRVGPERPQQLDPARADAERRGLDALLLDASRGARSVAPKSCS